MDSKVVHLACTSKEVHFTFFAVNNLQKLNKVTNIVLINLSVTLCFVFPLNINWIYFPYLSNHN